MMHLPSVILTEVNPPRYHESLFQPLFHLALPDLKGWATDLGHDTLILSHCMPGDVLVWSWRETGTHLMDLEECFSPRVVVEQTTTPHPNWYLIQVEGRHGPDHRYAKGWLTHIGHADADTVIRRITSARNRMLEARRAKAEAEALTLTA